MPELPHGVYTALVTPFTKEGEVDWSSYKQLLDFQMSSNISGVVVCGSTGETPNLEESEKRKLLEIAVEKFKRKTPIYVGVGSNSTKETIINSKAAIESGADGLLIVTPYYNKPGQDGLYQHFKMIAEEFSSTPILLYDVPSRTGISISIKTINKLATDFKNIVGIKDATGDIGRVTNLRNRLPQSFKIFLGDDAIFYPSLTLGADGVISVASNIIPKQFLDIYNSVNKGNYENALNLHNDLFDLINGLFIETNPIPIKWALMKANIISNDFVRLPLTTLSKENQTTLDQILKKII